MRYIIFLSTFMLFLIPWHMMNPKFWFPVMLIFVVLTLFNLCLYRNRSGIQALINIYWMHSCKLWMLHWMKKVMTFILHCFVMFQFLGGEHTLYLLIRFETWICFHFLSFISFIALPLMLVSLVLNILKMWKISQLEIYMEWYVGAMN